VAMAGERFRAEPLVEISAVCTHPDHQGRGLARRLIERLLRTQRALGQTPFLHVMQHNTAAVRLYERMGFVTRQALAVRVIARQPG
jgi:predicted GNAT family acetyltransferase